MEKLEYRTVIKFLQLKGKTRKTSKLNYIRPVEMLLLHLRRKPRRKLHFNHAVSFVVNYVGNWHSKLRSIWRGLLRSLRRRNFQ